MCSSTCKGLAPWALLTLAQVPGGMSLSCTKELLTRSTMVKISCKRSRTLIMPLMKRAGAPIESLFRSTYDLFISYHREGVWDPSVSMKILTNQSLPPTLIFATDAIQFLPLTQPNLCHRRNLIFATDASEPNPFPADTWRSSSL